MCDYLFTVLQCYYEPFPWIVGVVGSCLRMRPVNLGETFVISLLFYFSECFAPSCLPCDAVGNATVAFMPKLLPLQINLAEGTCFRTRWMGARPNSLLGSVASQSAVPVR